MNRIGAYLLCAFSAMSMGQKPKPASSAQSKDVMVVAVAHDDMVVASGIGFGAPLATGEVGVEPLAWLTQSGEWKAIRCASNHQQDCNEFERQYLSKPHTYTVVSAEGKGVAIRVKKMKLDDECFGYGGKGTFSGSSIPDTAVAAGSTSLFAAGKPARRLATPEAEPIRKAFVATIGDKLASAEDMRVYSVRLQGKALFVVQRAFKNYAEVPDIGPDEPTPFIFAIGSIQQGRFHLLFWKQNTVDESEQILGLIHLKNGRDFLVNTVSDPETQFFRVYSIRNGKLIMIFSGGGGGC